MFDVIHDLITTDEELTSAEEAAKNVREKAGSPFSESVAIELEKSIVECKTFRIAALAILEAEIDENSEQVQKLILEMRLAKNALLRGIGSVS